MSEAVEFAHYQESRVIFWLIVVGIVVIAVGIVVGTGIQERRMDEKVSSTTDWLETEATIQNAAVERLDKYTSYPGFAFSYSAQGEYLSGKFFLKADQEQSAELVRTLVGQKLPVEYDPGNPSAWYIPQGSFSGHEIIQKLSPDYPPDIGPYRGDYGQPFDMHLNG